MVSSPDIKVVIAYFSVVHMSFLILVVSLGFSEGDIVNSAVSLSHAVASSFLFFWIG